MSWDNLCAQLTRQADALLKADGFKMYKTALEVPCEPTNFAVLDDPPWVGGNRYTTERPEWGGYCPECDSAGFVKNPEPVIEGWLPTARWWSHYPIEAPWTPPTSHGHGHDWSTLRYAQPTRDFTAEDTILERIELEDRCEILDELEDEIMKMLGRGKITSIKTDDLIIWKSLAENDGNIAAVARALNEHETTIRRARDRIREVLAL